MRRHGVFIAFVLSGVGVVGCGRAVSTSVGGRADDPFARDAGSMGGSEGEAVNETGAVSTGGVSSARITVADAALTCTTPDMGCADTGTATCLDATGTLAGKPFVTTALTVDYIEGTGTELAFYGRLGTELVALKVELRDLPDSGVYVAVRPGSYSSGSPPEKSVDVYLTDRESGLTVDSVSGVTVRIDADTGGIADGSTIDLRGEITVDGQGSSFITRFAASAVCWYVQFA